MPNEKAMATVVVQAAQMVDGVALAIEEAGRAAPEGRASEVMAAVEAKVVARVVDTMALAKVVALGAVDYVVQAAEGASKAVV